jgi:hypothetical protein
MKVRHNVPYPIVEIGSGLANTFAVYRRTEPRR